MKKTVSPFGEAAGRRVVRAVRGSLRPGRVSVAVTGVLRLTACGHEKVLSAPMRASYCPRAGADGDRGVRGVELPRDPAVHAAIIGLEDEHRLVGGRFGRAEERDHPVGAGGNDSVCGAWFGGDADEGGDNGNRQQPGGGRRQPAGE